MPSDADISVTNMRPGRRDSIRAGALVSYYQNGRVVGLVGVNAMAPFNSLTRALLVNPDLVAPAVPTPAPMPIPEPAPVAQRRLYAVA
jgi:hypothetical protein